MPSILTAFGYHYFFYSNEGEPLEPVHIHVSKGNGPNTAKFWINSDGSCEMESNPEHIPSNDLRKIKKTIELYADNIVSEWKRFFQTQAVFHDGPVKGNDEECL